jgi:hypothetical protein
MAQVLNEAKNELELAEGEQLELFGDSEEQTPEPTVEAKEDNQPEEVIPEKYQNKSVTDIIAMHQNAEQLLGKQGQEVGELRRIVDDFIKSQTVEKEAHAVQEIDEDEFFTNPREAVAKLVENHPSVKQSQELNNQMYQQNALNQLKAKHPDYTTILQDSKFAEWVGASKVRTRLLQEADQQYNFDSADELLSLWKERQENMKSTVEADKKARKEQVKTASTGTSRGSGEKASRKVYRRADIIELMQKDPARYETLASEIRQAYAEGRVK